MALAAAFSPPSAGPAARVDQGASLSANVAPIGGGMLSDGDEPDVLSEPDFAGGRPGGGDTMDRERPRWGSRGQFLMVLAGYAIGIGNVWRFPYVCGKHGGGAFLIAYVISLVLFAAPLFFYETVLGQRFQRGPVETFRRMYAPWKGLAYVPVWMMVFMLPYYQTLISWCLSYFARSFQVPLPWTLEACKDCTTKEYFEEDILHLRPLSDPQSGLLQVDIVFAVFLVWVVTALALVNGKNTLGKIAYFTVLFPFVLMVAIFCKAVALDGAGAGVSYYLTPKFEYLFRASTWGSAAGQILFSLSPASGVAISLASFNEPDYTGLLADNLFIVCTNSGFSIFGGFVTFSVVGHLAHRQGLEVSEVAASGTGLAFEVFAEVLGSFGGAASALFAVCFFFMLLLLGLDSSFAWLETLQTYAVDWIQEKYCIRSMSKRATRHILLAMVTIFFMLSLPFATSSGYYFVDVLDHFCPTYCLLFTALLEYWLLGWKYGAEHVAHDVQAILPAEKKNCAFLQPNVLRLQMCYIAPAGLSVLLLMTFISDTVGEDVMLNEEGAYTYQGYPLALDVVGWLSFMLPLTGFAISVYRFEIQRFCYVTLAAPLARRLSSAAGDVRPPRDASGPRHVGGGYPHPPFDGAAVAGPAPSVVGRPQETSASAPASASAVGAPQKDAVEGSAAAPACAG